IAAEVGATAPPPQAITLADGRAAWRSTINGKQPDTGKAVRAVVVSTSRDGAVTTMLAIGTPDGLDSQRDAVSQIADSLALTAPQVYGIPHDQALFELGGESNNPREYDPATSDGNALIFSTLVAFSPQLAVEPDLASSWDVSADGTVYTFHLRPSARFHNGRPVVASDVVYSWERAADPATNSNLVLTYLGDIVGLADRRAGKAQSIRGIAALDDHTLQVTIDAPKPYFLMKLTHGTAGVVDRSNVESSPEWYRTPNGSGPYRLARWDRAKLQLYERNDSYYLPPPAIRYIVVQLYSGLGLNLYETGAIDMTGIGRADVARMRDPDEPLHADLREGVSMCTSKITFDVQQPPFDDAKVRQAFALAVDKARYNEVVLHGEVVTAHGLYPPALPGYNPTLHELEYDPALARQRLAESRYSSADQLPPIVFTTSGYGSDVSASVDAVVGMWQSTLGVKIQVENLEPDHAQDEIQAGRHGQVLLGGWCADYPDPENFADVLFHTGAEFNDGNYSNPTLDRLLEQARVERDPAKRLAMYQQAETLIVDDAPAVFLNHGLSFVLVKPRVKGYVLTPIHYSLERYLSLEPDANK
ncbi:MAG TPA: peptide ABC transporter substrate-binding protein, partial [Chloroflexia bacterium]|nr:peptide ABC transporter substrate-binding protein [Chloroflexia bacterium]